MLILFVLPSWVKATYALLSCVLDTMDENCQSHSGNMIFMRVHEPNISHMFSQSESSLRLCVAGCHDAHFPRWGITVFDRSINKKIK